MSTGDESDSFPQSMRHKHVLDVAEEHPNASVEELASMVPSATPDLVEHVFEEYGDPAEDETQADPEAKMPSTDVEPATDKAVATGEEATTDEAVADDETVTTDENDSDAETDGDGTLSAAELSEKQRTVLEVVAKHPDATQQEIGNRLGVSATTVSNRVNSIEGFEWSERESFVERIFDEPPSADGTKDDEGEPTPTETDRTDTAESSATVTADGSAETTALEAELKRLKTRVSELEKADVAAKTDCNPVFEDPELVHKIIHACMNSEQISEEEELRILKRLLE